MADLKIQVIFAALDRITAPLKKILGGSTDTARALKATHDRLKELNVQQKDVSKFRELHSGLGATSAKLKDAQQHVSALAQKMKATESPTRAMTREFNAAVRSAGALKTAGQQQAQQLQVLRDRLSGAGISTSSLGQHERGLRTDIAATNTQLAEQQKRLAAVAQQQERMASARNTMSKTQAVAGKVAAVGATATATGMAMVAPVSKVLGESKHYEIETARIRALGTKTSEEKEHAIQFAKQLQAYGVSQLEKTELIRDSISIFADGHHAEHALPTMAKMKFVNDTLYPESAGERNAQLFAMQKVIELRGNAGSVDSFKSDADRVQKIIAATGGRVSGEDWRQFTIRSGVAGKGLTDNAFFNQMEPMLQELGGSTAGVGWRSLYNNIYQGRGTQRAAREMESLGLLNGTHIKYDKVGQLKYIQAGALLEGDLFKSSPLDWIEKVFLPKLAAKGITDTDAINDKIGALISNSNGAALLQRMVDQRAQIRKSERLNQNTESIDQLYGRAQKTGKGNELQVSAKVSDLKLELGNKILPLYTQGLETLIAVINKLNQVMERNPTLAKGAIVGFGALAAILLVLGPLLLGVAALLGPFAVLRFTMAAAGIRAAALLPMLGRFGGVGAAGAAGAATSGGAAGAAMAGAGAAGAARGGIFARGMAGVRAIAPVVGMRVATAWRAADPRVVAPAALASTKALVTKIPAAAKLALESTIMWGKELGSGFITGIKAAGAGAASYTRQVWAAVVAMRVAAGVKWSGAMGAIRTQGIGGTLKTLGQGALGGIWNLSKGAASATASGLRLVGQALLFVGRAALLNPIGLAITAIALAAFLIIRNWEPIKAFFTGLWTGFKEGLAPLKPMLDAAFSGIGSVLAPLKPVWDWIVGAMSSAWGWISKLFSPLQSTNEQLANATANGRSFGQSLAGVIVTLAELIGKFFQFGKWIVGGLVDGMINMGGAVKSTILGLADNVVGWFKERLGIKSPSRVFVGLGGHITDGLAIGIERGADDPLSQVNSMAKRLTQLGAGIAIGAAAMPAMALDMRPPVPHAPGVDYPLNQVSSLARHLARLGAGSAAAAAAAPAMAFDTRSPVPRERGVDDPLNQMNSLARHLAELGAGGTTGAVAAPAMVFDTRSLVLRLDDPLVQVNSLAQRLTQLGAGGATGAEAMPAMAFDTRPPLMGAAPGAPVSYDSHDTVQIHIAPTPGMDPQAIARAVAAELDRRDNERRARTRSSLHDY